MFKRNTIQRNMVLEAVNALRCHATADEVYAYIAKDHSAITRGTVYRNLNLLSGSGQILKVEVPGGADRYDHQCHRHYHIKCEKCGKVYDIDMEYLTNLEHAITNAHGFEISGHNIMFNGICPHCIE